MMVILLEREESLWQLDRVYALPSLLYLLDLEGVHDVEAFAL